MGEELIIGADSSRKAKAGKDIGSHHSIDGFLAQCQIFKVCLGHAAAAEKTTTVSTRISSWSSSTSRASTSLPNSSKIATPPCGRYKLICAVALVNVCTQPLRKLASDRQAKPRSIDRLWMLMTPRLRFQRRHLGLNPAVDLYSMPNVFRFKSSSLLSMQMNLFCFVRQLVQKRDAFYADDHEWHGARTLRAYDEK